MNESNPQRPGTRRRWLPAAAAALAVLLAFCGGFGLRDWQAARAVASVVSLDVNPSIQLSVNQKERVLSARPMNEDAKVILEGMELEGAQLNVAVNAVIGSLLQHGYLNELSSAILISVEDDDLQRAGRLEASLTQSVNAALETASAGASVLSQVLAYDAGLEAQAESSQISQGRAALIREVQAKNSQLDFDALAALTVKELEQLRRAGAPGMPIGIPAAVSAAEAYAGTTAVDSVTWDADPELDETPACYEIELRHPVLGELDYRIDAYTGAVLSGIPNLFGGTAVLPAAPENGSGGAETLPAAPEAGSGGAETLPAAPETPAAVPVTPSQTAPVQTAPSSAAPAAYIGEDAALAAALRHAGVAQSGTDYCHAWLEYDDGRPHCYEVEFLAGDTQYEYEIGLYDGAVLKYEHETHHSAGHGGSHHTVSAADCIGLDAAKEAACRHAGVSAGEVRWDECELDREDGCYEIEFRLGQTEYEYKIDAVTGAVLKSKQEQD